MQHKMGLITDFEAATAYESISRQFGKITRSRPLTLAERHVEDAEKSGQPTTFYAGPFRPEMTQREARQILGVTEAYVHFLVDILRLFAFYFPFYSFLGILAPVSCLVSMNGVLTC